MHLFFRLGIETIRFDTEENTRFARCRQDMTDEENQIQTIVLTGGPGGGKSTFIRELRQNPEWAGRFVALPETVAIAGATGISPNEKRFIY